MKCNRFSLPIILAGIFLHNPPPLFAEPILDNSFLIEEAYNQGAGIVQHIFTFDRDFESNDFVLNFTQEWPLFSLQHQLSYTLPLNSLSSAGGRETGIGDVALNYRYQLADGSKKGLAIAPAISAIIPTGSETDGLGGGEFAARFNLPVSLALHKKWTAHTNTGFQTGLDSGDAAFFAGGSLIWLIHDNFNFMCESLWNREAGEHSWVVNPGVRGAINFANGLQVVPGIGVPIGVGPSSGDSALFVYLSLEHTFL